MASFSIWDAGAHSNNLLFDLISPESLASIQPFLVRITLVKSQCLFDDDQPLEYVFFMEAGLATLIANTGDNARVQVNMVGREGFAGTVSLFDGDLRSMHSAEIQIAGTALRMPQARFQEALERLPDFRSVCMRHAKATVLQTSQLTACNARHSVSQRLCRLLLMVQDRLGGTTLMLSQEDIALMLGVRRAGISVATKSLQESGVLSQARGSIEIINRLSLLQETCKCYHTINIRHSNIINNAPSPLRTNIG